ncbi:serine protease [Sphaerochaeta sp.]|uniref:S1 family peptidase n=1 Tax=Sphaerochaeta sp. TaxID=1972642 RepID=UPI0025880054|nr:serine protease [Sphaerochaeta sp.]MDD3456849.1 serine protease [Sphaerochaeta sp.]
MSREANSKKGMVLLIVILSMIFLLPGCKALGSLAIPQQLTPVVDPSPSIIRISFLDSSTKGLEHVGTGFLYQSNNLVVTCAHVLPSQTNATPGKDRIEIELVQTGQKTNALVLFRDDLSDIALLKLLETKGEAFLAPSLNEPHQGLQVKAIGFPNYIQGYTGTYCSGGVIAQGSPQPIEVGGKTFTFAFADMSVNSGFSGGPLLDESGNVVGIVNGVKYYQASVKDAPVTITLFTPISVVDGLIQKNAILEKL